MANIQIIVDGSDETFLAGEIVSGKAIIILDKPLSVQEVNISFTGEAHVYWRRSDHSNTDSEEIFNNTMKLWPADEGPIRNSSSTMPTGKHEFKFSFPIPITATSHFYLHENEGNMRGQIRYFLNVSMVGPSHRLSKSESALVAVLEICDLNMNPWASLPITVTSGKTVCSWCCASGQIEVSIKLPKIGYAIGEFLSIWAEIANRSPRTIKEVRLLLFQKCIFHSQSGASQMVENTVIAKMIKIEPVLPGRTQLWENEGFPVPIFARTSGEACRIIEFSHHLVLEVVPRWCLTNIKECIPVMIGTVPVKAPAPDPRSVINFVEDRHSEYSSHRSSLPNGPGTSDGHHHPSPRRPSPADVHDGKKSDYAIMPAIGNQVISEEREEPKIKSRHGEHPSDLSSKNKVISMNTTTASRQKRAHRSRSASNDRTHTPTVKAASKGTTVSPTTTFPTKQKGVSSRKPSFSSLGPTSAESTSFQSWTSSNIKKGGKVGKTATVSTSGTTGSTATKITGNVGSSTGTTKTTTKTSTPRKTESTTGKWSK